MSRSALIYQKNKLLARLAIYKTVLWLTAIGVVLLSIYFAHIPGLHGGRFDLRVSANDSGVNPGEDLSTNPKPRDITISATVPDRIAPSTPILIAPENNSLLQNSKPSFVWQESEDNIGVTDYELWLDGELLFSEIPTTPTDNSQYKLTYDPITGYFTLTPKQNISNGSHTWKIRALDARDNHADSATWMFKIDTQAPNFIITKIEDKEVSISAFDLDTIPKEPHELTANQPLITGIGESGSSVQATIRGEGITTSTIKFKITDGKWSWQLGVLPRDTIIYLDFIITDEAGNVSILKNVPIILRSSTIIPTPPASPSLPGHPGPDKPIITIPDLSPAEWRHEIIEIALPFLPPSLQETVKTELISPIVTPSQPQSFKQRLGPLMIIMPVALSIGSAALLSAPHLTIGFIWQLFLLLIPILKRRYCSRVFAFQNSRGLPYAAVTYQGVTEYGENIKKTFATNIHGFYNPGKLPNGTYQASVDHPGFPLKLEKQLELQNKHWYFGQEFEINEKIDACLLIPVSQPNPEPLSRRLLLNLSYATSPRTNFRWIWLLLGGFVIFLYPARYNIIIFLLVTLIYGIDIMVEPLVRNKGTK